MKRKLSTTLALILLLLTVMTAAGCNKKTDDTEKSAAPTEAAKVEDVTVNEKTLADYDKVNAFKYFNIATGVETNDLNNSASANLVKEYTGYDVTYDQAPADPSDAVTAITNIFMLKSDYQAVKVSKAQFYTLLQSGALKDITEYVDASTNLKEQIDPFGWETAKKDGKIYGIPQKSARKAANTAIAFRLDWLNEYNEANPETQIAVPSEENNYSMTTSEFKTMLTFFATKVPKGGKAMAVDTNSVFIENILPAFGVYQEWADVSGELQYVINQPGFEDYMKYMEDLFDSDLIQYAATANDSGAVKSLQAKTSGAGRVAHWNAATIEATETQTTDPNISYIQALVPDSNKGDASAVRTFAGEGYSFYTVLPNYATDEQAAAVVDWVDKKLDQDFFLKLTIGTEGETFKMVGEDYYPILPAFDEQQSLADKFMDGSRESDYSKYWMCRTRKTEAQDKMFTIANYNIDKTGVLNPISVMPPVIEYDTYYSGTSMSVIEAIVTGMYQKGVTKSLDELKAVFTSANGQDITTGVNGWYSAWSAKDSFNAVKPR